MGVPPGKYFAMGGPVDRARASLRVKCKLDSIEKISALMGVEPTKVSEWPGGRAVWSLNAADTCTTLEAALADLLQNTPDNRDVWTAVRELGDPDIFCGVFMERENRGFELDAATVQKLADRGLSIGFDIFYVGPGDSAT